VDTRVWARDRPLLWFERERMLLAFQSFVLYDTEGEKQRAKVYRIGHRNVYFFYEGSYYRLPLGDSVTEALAHALSDEEIESLGLPPEPEKKEKSEVD
jgi:hypothetical protein